MTESQDEDAIASMRKTESVWDYPRPPRLEPTTRHLRIVHAGIVIADTTHAFRILETSHPPVYYLAPADIAMHLLAPSSQRGSFCEFKGIAQYWDLDLGSSKIDKVRSAAWSYPKPTGSYAALAGFLAFYSSRVDECTVNGERVVAQAGDFYGGWITSDITGPFKGPPGTLGW